jgi:uncharacterized metal-binding protein YceD (DUF177 family)
MKASENILDKYKIPISGLSTGVHEYMFLLDDDMFSYFKHPDVEKGSVTAKVILEKRPTVIELDITMNGSLTVQCDRCLETFQYPIESEEKIVYTMGKLEGYDDEEIVIISKEQSFIDLTNDLYEIAVTQIPISKIHPNDAKGKPACNPEMLKILEQYIITGESTPTQKLSDIL